MDYKEILKNLTSGEVPTGAMGGGGILLLLLAVKTAKGLRKAVFVLAALALLAGAVWWHFHQRH
jgi:uncharacterized membrane protein YebE (DUF533 family)